MAIISSTPNNQSSGVLVVAEPTITNTVIALADTEQSVVVPASRRIYLNARGSSTLKLAFVAGGTSGSAYRVVRAGFIYESPPLDGASLTLYISSNQAAETVEIESWV